MSGGIDLLELKEEDVTKMLIATTHLGSENVNFQMGQYVYKQRVDGSGINIINLRRTWEKLLLAARAIVAIEHPAEVYVISCRNFGQRAVLKFAHHTGATPIAGRFTPGAFTNQIQAAFREPRLLVVTDPTHDHQPISEASYVNIPVIAFCNTDSPLTYVDIAIPCNIQSKHSIGLMWWLLTREVLKLRGSIPQKTKWNVAVDLFFYRDAEEVEKEEQAAKELLPPAKEFTPGEPTVPEVNWGNDDPINPVSENWADEAVPVAPAPPAPVAPAAALTNGFPTSDWSAPQEEWSASTPQTNAPSWGGASSEKW